MPNWCNNTLKITGDPQQIKRLPWKDVNQSASSGTAQLKLFQSLLPCPDGLNGQEQYYWSVENWGVKWDCSVEIVDFSGDFIELEFDTPWNAPHKGIGKIATMFPLLNFYMQSAESGCDWQGSFSWSNGKLIKEINGTYYAQSPCTCPECHSDYFPQIDLQGEITYHECFECAWSN
jgi:hypothetical protein